MNIVELHKDRMQDSFSKDFLWGAAISAKQAEGDSDRALTVADLQNYDPHDKAKVKGDLSLQEIMDRIEHPQDYIFPKKTGIDFYHRFRDDIKLLKDMGIKCFRFSVSWARIYPDGAEEKPSEKGLLFYDQLLDILKEMDIEPIVTLYHDDMPVDLALKYNGFLHPRVVDLFVEYAALIMKRYQHKVTYWIPVNQINLTRVGLSSIGVIKDTVEDVEAVKWQGVHHKFIACAKIREIGRTINAAFRFGAMLADFYVSPMTCKPEDVVFATEKNQMTMFFFADVQLRGEYPGYALRYFKDNSIAIHADEKQLTLLKNPLGLYDCFLNYWDRYGKPLMIAENGFGQIEELDSEHKLHDDYRIDYIKEHIRALQKAVQHGVDVFAYCAWSPIDMVSSGTSEMKKRYGFIYNDQDDAGHGTRKRYPKDSYWWYRNVIATNGNVL